MQDAAHRMLVADYTGTLYLWVLEDNHAAIGFYHRLGGIGGNSTEINLAGMTVTAIRFSWQLTALATGYSDGY